MMQVLVVEDDPTLAHAIVRNLSARGYATQSAGTVEAALAVLQEGMPALILLDIDLPDGSGWEIARRVQAAGGRPAVVTMSALRPNPRLCSELQVAGVLEKPFPMESLLRLAAEHAGQAHSEKEERHA